MEIKIPKEVHQHRETIFFGLSTRQFLCSALAVGAAVGVYLMFKGVVGQEAASWLCILTAAPIAVTGFFRYNGLTFERFVWAFLKSRLLCAAPCVPGGEYYPPGHAGATKDMGNRKEAMSARNG